MQLSRSLSAEETIVANGILDGTALHLIQLDP
jgi:hypothetical protein